MPFRDAGLQGLHPRNRLVQPVRIELLGIPDGWPGGEQVLGGVQKRIADFPPSSRLDHLTGVVDCGVQVLELAVLGVTLAEQADQAGPDTLPELRLGRSDIGGALEPVDRGIHQIRVRRQEAFYARGQAEQEMIGGLVELARRGPRDRLIELTAQLLQERHGAIELECPPDQEAAKAQEGLGPGRMVVWYLVEEGVQEFDRGGALFLRGPPTRGRSERAAQHALQEREHGMLIASWRAPATSDSTDRPGACPAVPRISCTLYSTPSMPRSSPAAGSSSGVSRRAVSKAATEGLMSLSGGSPPPCRPGSPSAMVATPRSHGSRLAYPSVVAEPETRSRWVRADRAASAEICSRGSANSRPGWPASNITDRRRILSGAERKRRRHAMKMWQRSAVGAPGAGSARMASNPDTASSTSVSFPAYHMNRRAHAVASQYRIRGRNTSSGGISRRALVSRHMASSIASVPSVAGSPCTHMASATPSRASTSARSGSSSGSSAAASRR